MRPLQIDGSLGRRCRDVGAGETAMLVEGENARNGEVVVEVSEIHAVSQCSRAERRSRERSNHVKKNATRRPHSFYVMWGEGLFTRAPRHGSYSRSTSS